MLCGGCLAAYDMSEDLSPSPYTDEDAGTGYEVDLAGEDLASGSTVPGRYHPLGYSDRAVHGRDLKLQVQDCRTCHAADLTGGQLGLGGDTTMAPPSCDSCHQAGWRTNCTYCHGTAGGNGNPPRDISGEMDPTKISFPGHVAHVSGRITQVLDCAQCHRKPTDVLFPYHVFDASPRRGENDLSGGLSAAGVYDPVALSCNGVYCHGNGRTNGTIKKTVAGPLACSSCHADMSVPAAWATMSSNHRRHLGINGVDCTQCHNGTSATSAAQVTDKTLHLNGKPDVKMAGQAATITYNAAGKTCTGNCHENHNNRRW
jgi:predicted CxxxxCH...CXXCH cytochrome family protein